MSRLSLRVLGTVSLMVDGRPLTAFKSDKGRALLIYLAVEADRGHRRERLAGLLWPEFPDRAALARLSDTLSNLRHILGDHKADTPFLTVSPSTLQFNTHSEHWLDLRAFERVTQALAEGMPDDPEVESALAGYRGAFLEGFSLRDSAAFEEWALVKREQMAQRMAGALRRLAARCESRGDNEAAQRHALRLVQLEPLDEESYRVSMRVLAAGGKRSAALAVYESCRRVLAQEFNVEPDRETIALQEAIRAGRYAPATLPPGLKRPAQGKLASPRTAPSQVPGALPSLAGVPVGGGRVALQGSPQGPEPPDQPRAAETPRAAAAGQDRPFVERKDELACLQDYLDQALAGNGRVVFVTGEAGSGKAALLAEFARRAMADDPRLVVAGGACNALIGVGDPYLPFRDILQMLGGDCEARRAGRSTAPEHARRLQTILPAYVQALVEHGPDLLDSFVPAAPLLARIQALNDGQGGGGHHEAAAQLAELLRRRSLAPGNPAGPAALFEQYAQVLRALAARQPLILLISDLQWADSGSLSLLFHVGRRLANSRILFLGTFRPDDVELGRDGGRHPLEGVVNELERAFGDLRVQLNALPGRAFVDALLDSEPNDLSESFRTSLARRTGGHPLFTVEMLRGLQERGHIVRDEQGRWVAGPELDWDRLPSRIEAVLAERVERLPAQCRALLEVASVEGEEFTAEVTARVLGAGEEEVSRWLSGLLRRQGLVAASSLRRLGSQRLARHRFTHYLLRQYLYSRLDPIQRSRLHEAVGRALEAAYGEQAPEIMVQLAWHFDQAGLAEKAVENRSRLSARE